MEIHRKNLRDPDETLAFDEGEGSLVKVGDYTVGKVVQHPGWRWSTHMRPVVGGDWCQARHIGVILSGRIGIVLSDGTTDELGPDDVYDIPPGHDGYTIGDEPAVMVEWSGLRTFAGAIAGSPTRTLATLLFTDLVDSTAMASQLGDATWQELLELHYEAARAELERYRGREVKLTGDGLLATFDGPARAVQCVQTIGELLGPDLPIRAGVHTGEVELVGEKVRGLAVHIGSRVASLAHPGEVLASSTVKDLVAGSGIQFVDRGAHALKGVPGEWHLFAAIAAR
ncbi:MAG: adenylate/guanylate cyclase domain-containing protein [Actinomycetota bacterium]